MSAKGIEHHLFKDISGEKREELRVIRFSHMLEQEGKKSQSMWICKCGICNKETTISRSAFRVQKTCSQYCSNVNKAKNKIGSQTVFKHLTLLKLYTGEKNSHGEVLSEFQCCCGKICYRQLSYVISGRLTSCGCLHHPKQSNHPRWKGCGEISQKYWSGIEKNLQRKSKTLIMTIDIKYAWELFLSQDKTCALTGLLISVRDYERTASLDRIDSSKGYVHGNVQWVHKDVNLMKWDFDQKHFIYLCSRIAENHCIESRK